MIEVENLTRVFRTYKKQPGFWGGVKGLFRREFEEVRAAVTKWPDYAEQAQVLTDWRKQIQRHHRVDLPHA